MVGTGPDPDGLGLSTVHTTKTSPSAQHPLLILPGEEMHEACHGEVQKLCLGTWQPWTSASVCMPNASVCQDGSGGISFWMNFVALHPGL